MSNAIPLSVSPALKVLPGTPGNSLKPSAATPAATLPIIMPITAIINHLFLKPAICAPIFASATSADFSDGNASLLTSALINLLRSSAYRASIFNRSMSVCWIVFCTRFFKSRGMPDARLYSRYAVWNSRNVRSTRTVPICPEISVISSFIPEKAACLFGVSSPKSVSMIKSLTKGVSSPPRYSRMRVLTSTADLLSCAPLSGIKKRSNALSIYFFTASINCSGFAGFPSAASIARRAKSFNTVMLLPVKSSTPPSP